MMNETLKRRLAHMLTVRKLSQNEVSRRVGGSLGLVRDILSGKSKSPTLATLQAIADVLNVSVQYLLGEIDSYFPVAAGGGAVKVKIVGRAAAGSWIESGESFVGGAVDVLPDSRFPDAEYVGYRVEGTQATLVAPAGSVAICLPIVNWKADLREGMILVVQRRSSEGLVETSIRSAHRLPDGWHLQLPTAAAATSVKLDPLADVTVIAVVLTVINRINF